MLPENKEKSVLIQLVSNSKTGNVLLFLPVDFKYEGNIVDECSANIKL